MFELIQLFSDCCTRQLHCLFSARNFNRVRMRLERQKNPDLYVLYRKAGERERDGVKQKRGTETQTARERLPRLTGGEQNELGINGTVGPQYGPGAVSGVGTGLLSPRAVLSIPRRPPSPPGHPPPARYFQTVSAPPPPSPLVFLLLLSVTLPSRKTSAVRDKPTPAATPIFFLLSLSLSSNFFSPLKVHLKQAMSSQTKKVRAGGKGGRGCFFRIKEGEAAANVFFLLL